MITNLSHTDVIPRKPRPCSTWFT